VIKSVFATVKENYHECQKSCCVRTFLCKIFSKSVYSSKLRSLNFVIILKHQFFLFISSISKSPSEYFVIHSVRRHNITSSPVSKNTTPLLNTQRFPTHIPINGVIRRIFTKTHKNRIALCCTAFMHEKSRLPQMAAPKLITD
jgi:hypothetical protein